MNTDPFKEYIKESEPGNREKVMHGIPLSVCRFCNSENERIDWFQAK